jgi:membrane fusion protein (multidrug efflux system)
LRFRAGSVELAFDLHERGFDLRLYRSNFISASALFALWLAGCAAEPTRAPVAPPPEVATVTVTSQPVPNVIELPGRLEAVRTAEVRARVDGIVQRRLYDEGTDVKAGQALFAIDPRALSAQLSVVKAALARAEATASNAAQDVARFEGLVAKRAISQQEYDTAVARKRTAEADVAQARAQVQVAQLDLSYTKVSAPIAGRAGRAHVTEGALVSASSATLLTVIEQIDPIFVNFAQSSADLLSIRRDIASGALKLPARDQVEVHLVLEDGSVYGEIGRINFLDLKIDPTTGSTALRAQFPNLKRALLAGQFVRARIDAGVRTDGILIPQRAVSVAAQGASVLVVGAKDLVEVRPVTLGPLKGEAWVVLRGLTAGERVIVDGLQKAQPGKPVRAAPAQPEMARPTTPDPVSQRE